MELDKAHLNRDRSASSELAPQPAPQTGGATQGFEARFVAVVEHMAEAFVDLDMTGCCTYLNRRAEQLLAVDRSQALGQSIGELFAVDTASPLFEQYDRALAAQVPIAVEVFYPVGDRWLAMRLVPTSTGLSIYFSDITDPKVPEVATPTEPLHGHSLLNPTASGAEAAQRQSVFLAEISAVLASSLEYERTLQSVANLAVPYFADWCSVDLLNDDRTISRVAVAHPDPAKVVLGWNVAQRFPRHLDDGYGISEVMQSGRVEIAPEITDEQLVATIQDAEYLRILRELGLRSCIIAPLQTRGRVLGSISFIYAESNRRYCAHDLALAEDLARRAATAIDNARLYQAAQQARLAAEKAADRTARLQTVTAALSESLTPLQVADVIVEQSMSALEADSALMVLVTEDRTELEIVKAVGYEPDLVASWRRFSIHAAVPLAEAIRTGEPAWMETLADRVARYPHLAHIYTRYEFASWMSLPLVVEGKSVGGMLLSFQEFRQLSQDDRDFILALSRQCAQAIFRAQLYEAERQARADAEQANRVKDEFLAVLSHELRSPLNPILGWTKMLKEKRLAAAKAEQALDTIERNAKLQAQLIEDLLDVSRILQGKMALNIAPVNLVATLEAALETVHLAAEAKNIHIATSFHSIASTVLGDPNRLQQAAWNLLSNAVKFTPAGGRVEVRLERIDRQAEAGSQSSIVDSQPDSFAEITVTDTGRGINREFLPYVFDYFRQEDGTTTRQFGGLGLGLAIVRHIIELHGGSVCADSPGPNLGATFTIQLPLNTVEPKPVSPHRPPTSQTQLTGVHVFVVDDDADMRELASFILTQAGAHVTTAASATQTLLLLSQAAIDRSLPDLLLCDIGMPEMDGYSLIQQIRTWSPDQGGAIPAIALTAYAGAINQQQALAAGFQQHISKPVEPDALVAAVANLVKPLETVDLARPSGVG